MVEYFAKWRSELDQPAKVAASEGYESCFWYGASHGGGSGCIEYDAREFGCHLGNVG